MSDRGRGDVDPSPGNLDVREYLVRCREAGDRVGFTFVDGTEFLGWVVEVDESGVVLSWAPSPVYAQATGSGNAIPPDESAPFDGIRTDSLARYDQSVGGWIDFPG
jgi:hypothetical protein